MTNVLTDSGDRPALVIAQYVYAAGGALGALLIAERIFHTVQIPLPEGGYRIPPLASAFSQAAQLFTYFFTGWWMGVWRSPNTLSGGLIASAATVAVRVAFVLMTHRYMPHGVFLVLGIVCGVLGVAVGKKSSRLRAPVVALTPAGLLIAGIVLVALGLA